jgi:hypothetical protein
MVLTLVIVMWATDGVTVPQPRPGLIDAGQESHTIKTFVIVLLVGGAMAIFAFALHAIESGRISPGGRSQPARKRRQPLYIYYCFLALCLPISAPTMVHLTDSVIVAAVVPPASAPCIDSRLCGAINLRIPPTLMPAGS